MIGVAFCKGCKRTFSSKQADYGHRNQCQRRRLEELNAYNAEMEVGGGEIHGDYKANDEDDDEYGDYNAHDEDDDDDDDDDNEVSLDNEQGNEVEEKEETHAESENNLHRLDFYRFQRETDRALDVEPLIHHTKSLDGSYHKGKLRQYITLVEYIARVDRLSETESSDLILAIKRLSYMNDSEIYLPAR
jgi:hypothetical protein